MEPLHTNVVWEALSKSELFRNLDPPALRDISDFALHYRYHRKEFITHQGDAISDVRLIYSGRAKYSYASKSGEQLLFGWLSPGATFGLRAFAAVPNVERFTVQAVDDCETLNWNTHTVKILLIRYPTLLSNVITLLGTHWDRALEFFHRLLTESAPYRVAYVLEIAMRDIGQLTTEGTEILISDEEIAEMASTTLFTVSRLIQRWSRLGLLVKSRGKIVIPIGGTLLGHVESSKTPHVLDSTAKANATKGPFVPL